MAQLQEAVETYTYVISGLSGETQMSYCDKLAVFVEFCAGRDIHTLEDLTPKVFSMFRLG